MARATLQAIRPDLRMQTVTNDRQQEILKQARANGRVTVEDLAARFEVTPQTIRKDLNDLCERRLLSRVHGGAIISSGVSNLAYQARRFVAQTEKEAIGLAAARHIPNRASLFINIGTTTEEVAKALSQHEDLLVITNNLNVATLLYPNPHIDVIVAGGPVRRVDGAVVGDYREVRVSRAIIENARHVILVADKMKFERTAPVRIGHVSEIDLFVTDRLPDGKIGDICREHSVEVQEVGGSEDELAV
jgi:DeoR family glycerol-3-phosphate regulon repressor